MSLIHTAVYLFEPTLSIPWFSAACGYDLISSPVLDNHKFPSHID